MHGSSGHVSSWLRFGARDGFRVRRDPAAAGGAAGEPPVDSRPGRPAATPVPDTLRNLYDRYREHEARELLTLMPRVAFRRLYGTARKLAQEGDVSLQRALDDGGPMELAAQFALRCLPLPPYEIWVDAYRANRPAFLERLGIEAAPSLDDPVAVSVRPIGDGWYASLCVVRGSEGWTGAVRFHRTGGERAWTTSSVFRADDVTEIRERFRSFDDNTLRAFLRSVLP